MTASTPNPERAPDPVSAASAVDPVLLEQVLRETSDALALEQRLEVAEREAFEEVARRYRGQPLTLEPVAAGLVHAVLRDHFQGLPGFADFGPALALRIAQTLMDDPAASERLTAFWTRLAGETP